MPIESQYLSLVAQLKPTTGGFSTKHSLASNLKLNHKSRPLDLETLHNNFDEAEQKKISKVYPQAKIKPSQLPDFTHLKKSQVNRTIQNANHVIYLLFKQKCKSDADPFYLAQLLKYFSITMPKLNGYHFDLQESKKPEFQQMVNFAIMKRLYKDLNESNGNVVPESNQASFKYHVSYGNNHNVVKSVISRRSWWHRTKTSRFSGQQPLVPEEEQPAGASFLWTAWRRADKHQFLK